MLLIFHALYDLYITAHACELRKIWMIRALLKICFNIDPTQNFH